MKSVKKHTLEAFVESVHKTKTCVHSKYIQEVQLHVKNMSTSGIMYSNQTNH